MKSARPNGITAATGDARELDEGDASWDAVLPLGPLHHLLDRADRVRAFAGARRVVRPGGVVLGATISRWASICETLLNGMVDSPPHLADGFTTVYVHRPAELPGEVADAGLHLDDLYAVAGSAQWMPDAAARLSEPDGRAPLLELARTPSASRRSSAPPHTCSSPAHR